MTHDRSGTEPALPRVLKSQKKSSKAGIFLKSFALIFIFVLSALSLWAVFSWLATENTSVTELYSQTLSGRMETRSLAGMEWVRRLQEAAEAERELSGLRPTVAQSERLSWELRNFSSADPMGRQDLSELYYASVASLVGFSGLQTKAEARRGLHEFLNNLGRAQLSGAHVAALLALIRLEAKSDEDVKLFLSAAADQDPSVRKAAAAALGSLGKSADSFEPELSQTLLRLLSDSVEDVRWNAAFSLLKRGDPRALGSMERFLKQAEEARAEDMLPTRLNLYAQTFAALLDYQGPEASGYRKRIKKIGTEHPQLRLRQLARQELAKKSGQ